MDTPAKKPNKTPFKDDGFEVVYVEANLLPMIVCALLLVN